VNPVLADDAFAPASRRVTAVAARKRAVDIVVGGALCLITLPLMLVLAIGVAISLRAWPFFVQSRPGWRGQEVTIVKLRTLATSTPRYMDKHTLGIESMKLPFLCRLMRRTHLDELPQIYSVVAGEMSLVGPRPALPAHVEPIDGEFDLTRRSVRPGCTGLWQLSVASSDTATSAPRFDLFYLRHASTRLDLWIMVRTVGWVLGLVKPIEIVDIPQRILGPGLLTDSGLRKITEQVPLVVAAERRAAWSAELRTPEPRQVRINDRSTDSVLVPDSRLTSDAL
jgi:lipopolysaccharide/colanic/teichoic acid biosynthesis glycosyltransferase